MPQGDRRVGSLSFKSDGRTYSVLSVWESAQYPGSYSISRDKGTPQYPAISFIEALKRWASGDGYLNVRTERQSSEREEPPRGGHQRRGDGGGRVERHRSDYGAPEPFEDDDIPFRWSSRAALHAGDDDSGNNLNQRTTYGLDRRRHEERAEVVDRRLWSYADERRARIARRVHAGKVHRAHRRIRSVVRAPWLSDEA